MKARIKSDHRNALIYLLSIQNYPSSSLRLTHSLTAVVEHRPQSTTNCWQPKHPMQVTILYLQYESTRQSPKVHPCRGCLSCHPTDPPSSSCQSQQVSLYMQLIQTTQTAESQQSSLVAPQISFPTSNQFVSKQSLISASRSALVILTLIVAPTLLACLSISCS